MANNEIEAYAKGMLAVKHLIEAQVKTAQGIKYEDNKKVIFNFIAEFYTKADRDFLIDDAGLTEEDLTWLK